MSPFCLPRLEKFLELAGLGLGKCCLQGPLVHQQWPDPHASWAPWGTSQRLG